MVLDKAFENKTMMSNSMPELMGEKTEEIRFGCERNGYSTEFSRILQFGGVLVAIGAKSVDPRNCCEASFPI